MGLLALPRVAATVSATIRFLCWKTDVLLQNWLPLRKICSVTEVAPWRNYSQSCAACSVKLIRNIGRGSFHHRQRAGPSGPDFQQHDEYFSSPPARLSRRDWNVQIESRAAHRCPTR